MVKLRTRRLTGIIVSLVLIVVLVVVFADPWSTLRNDSKRIVLADPDPVDRIEISDMNDSTLLIRVNGEWMLDGSEKVNEVTVENLLFAAGRLQINSIVTGETAALPTLERKIRFYKGEKVALSYTLESAGGQYMVRPARADRNFLVSVAGFSGMNLEKIFSSAPDHYRQHMLVELLPSEILRIEVELPGGESFRFTQDENGEISCLTPGDGGPEERVPTDELSVRLLFSYFTSIRYETRSGISAQELASSSATEERLARIHVESRGGESHTLQVFPFYEEPGAAAHMFKALVLHNNDEEAIVVKYIYLDVLMRGLSHYVAR